MKDEAEDTVTEALRDLVRWLYRELKNEYEHESSDSTGGWTTAINEWTFAVEGQRSG